jgi:hypothetical protein
MTTVYEMMMRDAQSVVGLTVEYDYGGSKPIVDAISNGRVFKYPYTIEDRPYVGKIYEISFMSAPKSYYRVHVNNVKILLTGVE